MPQPIIGVRRLTPQRDDGCTAYGSEAAAAGQDLTGFPAWHARAHFSKLLHAHLSTACRAAHAGVFGHLECQGDTRRAEHRTTAATFGDTRQRLPGLGQLAAAPIFPFRAPLPVTPWALSSRGASPVAAGRLLMVQPREGKPSTGVVARPSRSPSGSDGSRGWATLFELANTALCVLVALAAIAITQVAAPVAIDALWPDASPDPLLWAAGVAGLLWLGVVGFFFVTTNRHGGR